MLLTKEESQRFCCHKYKGVIHKGRRVWGYTVVLGKKKKVSVWRAGLFGCLRAPSKEEWDYKAESLGASGLEEGIGCIGKAGENDSSKTQMSSI